jgi:tRNA dimethylallyltransferase
MTDDYEDRGAVALIAGPTACGKSAAALALARATGGEIVNADALQVYRDLEILSARPDAASLASARHHLYGHVDAARRYSTGAWCADAEATLNDIAARGRLAIVVGGTGLYFRALEQGLSSIPVVAPDVRAAAQARLDAVGLAVFRAEIIARDPAMARIEAHDRQRHLRAYEVLLATGRPLSAFQSEAGRPVARARWRIVIEPDRRALYEAIDARFDAMLDEGAMEEAAALAARRLDPALPAMKAVGLRELAAVLDGAISLDEARATAKQASRNYAKRQLTWFRNQMRDWPRAEDPGAAAAALYEGFRQAGEIAP